MITTEGALLSSIDVRKLFVGSHVKLILKNNIADDHKGEKKRQREREERETEKIAVL